MSSDDKQTISEFQTALDLRDCGETDETDERPNWEPRDETSTDGTAHVECPECQNTVSKQFARVFGDNENRLLNGCPECSTYRELAGMSSTRSTTGSQW